MTIQKLQKKIGASKRLDAVLVVSPENRLYLTGFASSDGFLLVSAGRAFFITDSRYIEAARNAVRSCEVVLQGNTPRRQIAELFAELRAQTVGVEASRMTVRELKLLESEPREFNIDASSETDELIGSLRLVKSKCEIASLRAAQRIAESALTDVLGFIRPGVTEREIALRLDFYMLSHGAQALSFETIAVSGKNSSMPHGVPTDKRVEKGDFVTMDFGAVVNGYHSDMTRTVAVGSVSEKQREVYETVLSAQKTALEALRPGLARIDADAAARGVIEKAGYGAYFGHSTGHGVGIEIHEPPALTPVRSEESEKPLQEGNVLTVEPGIYLPGEFGVRIEDFVVITGDGYENLTEAEKELLIL